MKWTETMETASARIGHNEYLTSRKYCDNVPLGVHETEDWGSGLEIKDIRWSQKKLYNRRRKDGRILVFRTYEDWGIMESVGRGKGIDKAEVETMKMVIAHMFEVHPNRIKMRYSKNAGCSSCPCSPGWIIDLPEWHEVHDERREYQYSQPKQQEIFFTFGEKEHAVA